MGEQWSPNTAPASTPPMQLNRIGSSPSKRPLVAANIGLAHGGYLDLERLVLHAPDVLVFSRRNAPAPSLAEAQREAPALRALFARHTRPVQRAALDEALWTCPGSFNAEAVAQLRAARP